jgi:diguanylate cyclase (GGDEF)-like protein
MIYQRHISPDELLSTQLELVMQNGRLATLYSQLIGITATLMLFWPYFEMREMLVWTAVVVCIMLVRWLLMNHALAGYRFRRNPHAVLRQLIVGAALSGAVWSVVYIFVADRAPAAVQYVFLLIVFIITALSVGVTVIIREYFVAFLFTSLWPIAWWSLVHYWQQPHNLLVGLGLLAVCALFISLCDRVYQSYRNMIALNWERESMSRELGNLTGSLRDRNKQLQETRQQLTDLANVDELTGLGNRRLVNKVVGEEINRVNRSGASLSLILLDVDCFKNYNDTYGHSAGDRVLVELAAVMRKSVSRAGEVVARYGGEEFILILPGATASSALRTASRLRDRVLAEKIPHSSSTVSDYVTISQGVMTVGAGMALGPEELIDAADAALYRSKDAGRNAITVADAKECSQEESRNL